MVLLLPLAKDPCVFSPLSTGFGLLPILGNGLLLAFHTLSALLVVGAILLKPDTLQLLRLKSPSLGLLTLMFVSLLPMLLIQFDTFDRGVLDCVLCNLGAYLAR